MPEPDKPRKKRRRLKYTDERNEQFRAQIVAVARSMFIEEGYKGVSMRKIASRVPCATGTLYLYFPDKTAILMHIWEELFDISFKRCFTAASRHRKHMMKIRTFCIEYVHYWVDHPDHFHMIWLLDQREKSGMKYIQTNRALSKYVWIVDVVRDAIDNGEIEARGMSAAEIGDTLFSIGQGVTTHIVCFSNMNWKEARKFVEFSIDCVLHGLSPN